MQTIESVVPDSATQQVLFPVFAQKTASFALSGAMSAERADRNAITVGGIDGMSEYLNDLADRRANAQFREDSGFKVSLEQLPYYAGLSVWFEGRVIGLDGLPIGAQSSMDFRVQLDAQKLMTENPKRRPARERQFKEKVDLMRSAVARIDSYGESPQLPDGWLSMAVDWATDREEWLEGATFKPSADLDTDRFLIRAWIATT